MLNELSSKSNKIYRAAFIAAAAVIGLVASYGWLIRPHVVYLKAADNFSRQSDSLDKKTRILKARLAIKKIEIAALSKEVQTSSQLVFSAAQARQFVNNLQNWAIEHNCRIISLNDQTANSDVKPVAANKCVDSYYASATITGDYGGICNFLNRLCNRPEKVVIDPISIAAKADSENLECRFGLLIYVLNDKGSDANDTSK